MPDESGAVIDQRVRRDRDHSARVLRRHRDYALEDVGEDPDPRFTFANERTLLRGTAPRSRSLPPASAPHNCWSSAAVR